MERNEAMREAIVKKYMAMKNFSPKLQDEVLRHRRYNIKLTKGNEQKSAFEDLPETLTQDICNCMYNFTKSLLIV